MKRLSFLLAGMIAGIAGLMAEQPMWSVSGTVFDFEEEAVAGAMIFAKVDTVSIGSTSDKDGNFFLEFPPTDSLYIKAVMTGYKPKEEKIKIAGKNTEIDIVFDERSTKLEEVTVSCENAFVSDNGIKFYPTGYQKSASDDAYSLLNSMQLPGFDIDRHTGAANTRSGSVSYFIEGHPASDEELRSLRPKDVLRVEYYEYPLMQFNMMPNVINYVIKKYDYGGYATFSGRQSFLNENGDYRTALDGDSIDFPGFIAVGEDYTLTKSAELAKVYSGLSFFKLGEYENAISYLEQTSLSDDIMQYTVQGTIGDCYVQLGDSVEAVKYFINAAKSKNILVRPVYLVKAGLCYEAAGNYAKALEMYETVKNGKLEAQSGIPEVDNIDKYIARAAAHVE